MVSSNHSFWCSTLASRTPHRRMWENSSSRACSKGVGVDILRGSARFLAMLRDAPLGSGPERGGRGTAGPLKPPIKYAPQCNRARETAQRADMQAVRMVLSWTEAVRGGTRG